jgi:hypothetical protein
LSRDRPAARGRRIDMANRRIRKSILIRRHVVDDLNPPPGNDAVNRTEQLRSVTETETVGSVENPGFRAPITDCAFHGGKCVETPNSG